MGLNCDAHFGVNTAQERDVSTFPPGGGMRHRGGAQNAPRLQGGPLHVGWRGREHLVCTCACNPPEEPSMCVEVSQPSTTAQTDSDVKQPHVITISLSPHF